MNRMKGYKLLRSVADGHSFRGGAAIVAECSGRLPIVAGILRRSTSFVLVQPILTLSDGPSSVEGNWN
jgi:hypothetical protein